MSYNYRELKRIALTIDCHTYVEKGMGLNAHDFMDTIQEKIYDIEYKKESNYITAQEKEEKEEQRIKETIAAFKELQLNKKDVLK